MVRPRESREKRVCLACGGSTRVSHLGLDLCRACAVFHRRSQSRKFVCRSTTGDCSLENGRCRKCRFEKIEGMLVDTRTSSDIIDKDCISMSLLSKVSESMCDTRLISELSASSPPTHPLEMNDNNFIAKPANPSILNDANRVFLASILKFGSNAFPEFCEFKKDEKWRIATNFFHQFRLFEGGFRADKKFPDDFTKSFGSYTTYVSVDVALTFYEDAASNRMMADNLRRDLGPNRERFRRLKLKDQEFFAVLALMFWNTEHITVGEEIQSVGGRYKSRVLEELQQFYKYEGNCADYASRLGEVLLFIDIYGQLSRELNNKYELLRLANVFTDDTVLFYTAT